jgi:hypothetical protein
MNHKVGIWIDHKKAVIVSASGSSVTAKTLQSDVGPHTRSSGPEDGGGDKKYEDRHGQHLDRYYDEVISRLRDDLRIGQLVRGFDSDKTPRQTSAAVSRPSDFNETTQRERDSFMAIVMPV